MSIRFAYLFRFPKFEDAGIIKGKVQSAKLSNRRANEPFNLIFLRDINLQGTSVALLSANLLSDLLVRRYREAYE